MHSTSSLFPHIMFPLFCVPFLACSSNVVSSNDVNEGKIHGVYTVLYEATDKKLTMTAQLRVGGASGTTVKLDPPASMKMNNEAMNANETAGALYILEKEIEDPVGAYTFTWTRKDSSIYTNSAKMVSPVRASTEVNERVITKSADFRVNYEGISAQKNERISCHLQNTDLRTGQSMGVASGEVSEGKECIISRDALKGLSSGRALFYFIREHREKPQQGHDGEGGMIIVAYKSNIVNLPVAD